MTLTMPTDEQVARMREVFDLVKPRPNWKDPIHTYVAKTAATPEEIHEAVIFFCGGKPRVRNAGDRWAVTGAGYYVWCGA